MIFTQRPVPPPQAAINALLKPMKDSGKTELEDARAYYGTQPPPTKAFDFSRYKEYEVCLELDRLFKRKCAYCESKYDAVAARDVEHYRPKGAVAKAAGHPGYWWLAATWENLLPSCPACNQRRKHIEYRKGMTLEQIELEEQKKPTKTFGKGNSFPVRNDAWVKKEDPAALAAEDPFLINPCVRRPEDHLEWVFDYDTQRTPWEAVPILPLVRPRQIPPGDDDPYALASIAIYGLNRVGVFRSRMEHIQIMQKTCKTFANTFLALAKIPDPNSAAAQALLPVYETAHADMVQFMQPSMLYAGMARAFVELVRKELGKLGGP